MRERDKPMLQRAKLVIAIAAGSFAVFVWALNCHDPTLSLAIIQGCKDVMLFCLGATGAVMVSDSVEAIMTRTKEDLTSNETIDDKRDPKDFDVPLDEVNQ
jgi:hypothetical protein